MDNYDGVVIGAGHNGLTLAAYLARAGLKIAVVERNARVGGGCTHRRAGPARLSLQPAFQLLHGIPPFAADPRPRALSLRLLLYRAARSSRVPRSATAPASSSTRISTRPARRSPASRSATPRRSASFIISMPAKMRPLFTSLAFNAPLPIEQLKDRLSGPQAKEFLSHAQHDLFSVVRKHFDDDRIRTLFTSYMHVITTESVPGAGIVFPLIFANVMEFTLPVGGAASFTDALTRVIEACGGSVITGADVQEIVVRNGRAAGGAPRRRRHGRRQPFHRQRDRRADHHADGRRGTVPGGRPQEARCLALGQPQPGHAPSRAARPAGLSLGGVRSRHRPRVQHLLRDGRHRPGSQLLRGLRRREISAGSHGQRRLQQRRRPDLCSRRRAFRLLVAVRAVCGRWRRAELGPPTRTTTPSACSACGGSMHPISTTKTCARNSCSRRSTSSASTPTWCAARCAWAPTSPPSSASIVRIRMLSGTRTPIEALYLCGSSTGNGGGINGAPGYIAANTIADDLQLERPWTRVPAPEWRH